MRRTTYRPNKKRAQKKHGWRQRMKTVGGRHVIKRRKQKSRKRLAK